MINAAEPVDGNSLDAFIRTFRPLGLRGPPKDGDEGHGVVFPTYGLAEHTVFVCGGGACACVCGACREGTHGHHFVLCARAHRFDIPNPEYRPAASVGGQGCPGGPAADGGAAPGGCPRGQGGHRLRCTPPRCVGIGSCIIRSSPGGVCLTYGTSAPPYCSS